MGRHAAPGGDAGDRGNPSVPLNRRRTDAAAPPPAALPEDPGDHPTAPSRSRADRRRDGLLEAGVDPGRRPPRPGRAPASEPGPATPRGTGRPAPPESGRPTPIESGRPPGAAPVRPAAARSSGPARPVAAGAPVVPAAVPGRSRPAAPAPSRSRPPAAVAAAGARGASAAASPAAVAGPRTTVAPFQAVPAPSPTEHPSAPLPDVSSPGWDHAWLDEAPAVPPTVVPQAPPRPAEPALPAVTPAPAAPNGNPAYRDWTRPSGSGSGAPPATTAIPDREVSRGRAQETVVPATVAPGTEAYDARFGEAGPEAAEDAEPGPGEAGPREPGPREPGPSGAGRRERDSGGRPAADPASGSQTGVVGGRAALRAGRQAAEEERRRTARRTGVKHVRAPVPGMEDDEPRPARRRGVATLVAVVVVALLVLGVYSFASPETGEASDGRDAPAPTASAPVVTSGALPPLSVPPLAPVEQAPSTPVRVPVTVLNATGVTGLAGSIADVLAADGWETAGTDSYDGDDVAATTVYFTEGDETGQQSALQLVEAHPEVRGPAVRFFQVDEAAAGGLVVVAAGDWQP